MLSATHIVVEKFLMRCVSAFLAVVLHAATVFAWTPPLGVPVPKWPSAVDLPRPALPDPWTSDQANFYFVSPTGCSDARTYGNPAASRCTLPQSPSAGAVIVLNGTITESRAVAYAGRADSPIWVLGFDPANKPSVTRPWAITGSYLILDDLAFTLSDIDGVALVGHHIMVRNSTLTNPYASSNGSGFGIGGQNIVFYHNVISQMGNWLYTGPDLDRLGIKVISGAADVWIVDSTFYHCQSDGVQVGDANNAANQINRIYIARNVAYENLQFGFWTKNATDVIFSQNVTYGHHRITDSGPGGGLGGQYDPKFVWYLGNLVYDNNSGIHIAGGNSGGGGPWFVIGNVLVAIAGGNCNSYDFGAISYRNDGGVTVLFNTVTDVDFFGGFPPAGGTVVIRSNIFTAKRANSCAGIVAERALIHDYNLFGSAAYDPETEPHRVVGDPGFAATAGSFDLKAGSPAIDKAAPGEEAAFALFQSRYGLDIRKDVTGAVRPQGRGWDIGAYEFAGAIFPVPRVPKNLQILRR